MSLIFEAPDGRRACQHWWGHGVGRAVPMGWWDSGPTDVDQQDGSGRAAASGAGWTAPTYPSRLAGRSSDDPACWLDHQREITGRLVGRPTLLRRFATVTQRDATSGGAHQPLASTRSVTHPAWCASVPGVRSLPTMICVGDGSRMHPGQSTEKPSPLIPPGTLQLELRPHPP